MMLATIAAAQTPTPQAPGQAANPTDPLSLFAKMMPVFTHPRCLNCHGATMPSANMNHRGGLVGPGESCTSSCHDAAHPDGWILGPQFVGLDARQMCKLMADEVTSLTPAGFIGHLRNDKLIQLAYVGLAGGARTVPARPAMTHAQFLAAAQAWLDDGFGLCDLEGAITRTEEINSDRTYDPGSVHEVRVKQSGRREVTVRFANGRYETKVQVKGSITTTQTIRAGGCTTVITGNYQYADVDDPVPGNPDPVDVGQAGRASVEVKLEANGEYTVTIRLGEEKHRSVESTSLQDGCGSVLRPPPPETLEQVWPGTNFVFRGTLSNPRDRTQLVGRELKVWSQRVPDSPDEDPWLPDHYAAAAQDGTFHPVTIKTSWNFRYRP